MRMFLLAYGYVRTGSGALTPKLRLTSAIRRRSIRRAADAMILDGVDTDY